MSLRQEQMCEICELTNNLISYKFIFKYESRTLLSYFISYICFSTNFKLKRIVSISVSLMKLQWLLTDKLVQYSFLKVFVKFRSE